MIVPAHSGHWLVNVIYFAPVLLVVGWIGIQNIRDRRSGVDNEKETEL